MIPSVQYPVLKVPACGVAPAARSSAFVLGARLNNTRTPGPCPELFRLRCYLHILHTYGAWMGLGAALRTPCSQEGFGRFAPFPVYKMDAHGAGRRCAFHARDASIYRCDAGRGASRRGAGRFTTRCGRLTTRDGALHVTALGTMASCATPGGPWRAQALHGTGAGQRRRVSQCASRRPTATATYYYLFWI